MILVDTSAIVALVNPRDIHHREITAVLPRIPSSELFIVTAALTEIFYLVHRRVSYSASLKTFRLICDSFKSIDLVLEDEFRMMNLMEQYRDAKLDFVDTALIAVAERLDIERILTFDRRDFSMVRPQHVSAFTLLP